MKCGSHRSTALDQSKRDVGHLMLSTRLACRVARFVKPSFQLPLPANQRSPFKQIRFRRSLPRCRILPAFSLLKDPWAAARPKQRSSQRKDSSPQDISREYISRCPLRRQATVFTNGSSAFSATPADLKREIYELTVGWRETEGNNRILRFEPASSTHSVAFNPLDEIRLGTDHETGDMQNLATLIVDPDGKGLHTHWQKTACALMTGCIAHVLYRQKKEKVPATLPAVDDLLSDPDKTAHEVWTDMITYLHENGATIPIVAKAARDQLNRPEEEAGSVLSTTLSYLTIYRDPVVANNVSRSDFRIRDLMHSEEPVTLYIVTEPVDKQRLQPLVRVLVNMIVRLSATGLSFEGGMPKPNYRYRLLLMLDEFPSLGRLDILQESLAFLPGYGIKAYLIAQDINQLYAHYGRDEAITSTCHVQCAFAPNRIETAEHLSKLTGQTTVVKEQVTTSGRGWSTNVTRSTHEVSRPLLTPDEAMRMKGARKNAQGMITEPGNMVIYVAGYPAIMGLQPLYFRDSELARRARIPAESAQTKKLGDMLANANV